MLPKSSPAVSGQRAQRPAPVGHAALIQPRLVAQQANLVQSACIARNAAPAFARGRPRAERRPESGAARSVPANIVAASYEEPFSPQDQTACPLRSEADRLTQLLKRLKACKSQDAKLKALLQEPCVLAHKDSAGWAWLHKSMQQLPVDQQLAVVATIAAGQTHILFELQPGGAAAAAGHAAASPSSPAATTTTPSSPLADLASRLARVEEFYDSMGGLVGYQLTSLRLIIAGIEELEQQAALPSSSEGAVREAPPPTASTTAYLVPDGLDLTGADGGALASAAAAAGLAALPDLAEIYPVGGAGDRLGLTDEASGESLPAAMLPYCGRPILAALLRDLQAREYLQYKLTGQQCTTPVAIMTSDAKGNHGRITALMEAAGWFGRGRASFRLFRQPLVPVLSVEDGKWLLAGPATPMMKPGGHGAIWKLMWDQGVFDWLASCGRRAALVRQISNPLAGTDTTLMALAGTGHAGGKAFGFMSCERAVGASEGMNVLMERKAWVPQQGGSSKQRSTTAAAAAAPSTSGRPAGAAAASSNGAGRWVYQYGITNVEYTEFARLGISDEAVGDGSNTSVFPANTNVLYVDLRAARSLVADAVAAGGGDALLPGLIFNLKKKVACYDPASGGERRVQAGRMECTMQNLADCLSVTRDTPLPRSDHHTAAAHDASPSSPSSSSNAAAAAAGELPTFLVYNSRRRVTSSAKKKREPGSTKIHQTPDGSFYDLQRNAAELLAQCGMAPAPDVGDVGTYLASGPGFIFLYHPALGPAWQVICQKVRGGRLAQGGELVLEVAEARLVDVDVEGSLLVSADCVMGHTAAPVMVQSDKDGAPRTGVAAAAAEASSSSSAASHADGNGNGAASKANGSSDGAERRLVYSNRVGRINLSNVRVRNRGVDWAHAGNVYWRHDVRRHEALEVVLHGCAEFEAHDVTISGVQRFEVPDGHRLVVSAAPGGGLKQQLTRITAGQPTWEWAASLRADGSGAIDLQYHTLAALPAMAG